MNPILNGGMADEGLVVAKPAKPKRSPRVHTGEHIGNVGATSKTKPGKPPADNCRYRIIEMCKI